MTKKKYLARGCNIKDGISCGHVGEIHTLEEWVKLFLGGKGVEYFDGAPDKEVVEYIKANAWYRLEEVR